MKNKKFLLLMSVSITILLLASCGSPPAPVDSPDEAPAAEETATTEAPAMDLGACSNPFFPIEEEKTLVYTCDDADEGSEYRITFLKVTSSSFSTFYEYQDQSVLIDWTCTDDGLVPNDFFAANFVEVEGIDFDIETLDVTGRLVPESSNWEVGNTWDNGYSVRVNVNFQGSESTVEGNIDQKNTITAIESISVPAGSYKEAYRVDQEMIFTMSLFGTETQQSLSQTSWYVRDVGLVKSSSDIEGQSFNMELTAIE